MELTPLIGMSAHLLQLLQLACSLLLIIPQSKANCYTSEIKVPALQDTKHIELSINVDKEIASSDPHVHSCFVFSCFLKLPKYHQKKHFTRHIFYPKQASFY